MIIKDKLTANIPGTATFVDKYDVLSGIVGAENVFAGQLVDIDKILKDGVIEKATAATKRAGVVTHQQVKPTTAEEQKTIQTFKPGEVAGVCIRGFILAVAHKDDNGTSLKLENNEIKHDGSVDLALTTNIILTGKSQLVDKYEKKLVEVEVK